MKKVLNGCAWVFAIFCFLAALIYGLSVTSGIMLIVGILALPIKPIRNIRENIFGRAATVIRVIGLTILFCVGGCAAPQTEETQIPVETVAIESVVIEKESVLSEIESIVETVQMTETESKIDEKSTEVESNTVSEATEIETEGIIDENIEIAIENKSDDLGKLKVHFIDIGQGDCTLIENNDEFMLIDAGTNDKGTVIQNYLKKQGVKDLKYFVVTHDDSDHEGGADVVITKFNIENVFMCAFKKDTKTHNDVLNALKAKSMKWSTLKRNIKDFLVPLPFIA